MIDRTAYSSETGTVDRRPRIRRRTGGDSSHFFACRLGAGWLRASSRWARLCFASRCSIPIRLYAMTRYFLWLIPVTNLCLFLCRDASVVS